jgi:PD-(D/E)XK nuclease superfamily
MTATVIRASSLSRYADCPRRSSASMFRREIEDAGHKLRRLPAGVGALIGSATHRAVEFMLNGKLHDNGALPPLSAASDCGRDALQEQLAGGEVEFDATTASRAAAVGQTIQMVRVYHQAVAPLISPVHVEQRFEADVADNIVLSGQPDLVCLEPGQIDDLKTGAREPGNHNPQIGAYSLLAKSHNLDINLGVIDFIKRVPIGKPQPEPVRITVPLAVAESAAVNVLRHVIEDLRVFREGDARLGLLPGDPAAFLANPNSMLCSAKYCSAHGTSFCHEWRKKE